MPDVNGRSAEPATSLLPYRCWTKEEEDQLLAMLEVGVSRRAIADRMGRSVRSISGKQFLLARSGRCTGRDTNDPRTNRHMPWTDSDRLTLQQMIAAGKSLPVIARALRRTQTEIASEVYALGRMLADA